MTKETYEDLLVFLKEHKPEEIGSIIIGEELSASRVNNIINRDEFPFIYECTIINN